MARKTEVQSQVKSYQKTQKWYLIPPCLTLSIIRYVSRVKWSNPGKGVAPSPAPQCSSYWKGSLRVALDYGRQLYYLFLHVILVNISKMRLFVLLSFLFNLDDNLPIALWVYIYIYISCSWPTVAEGDPKAPFSIATTLNCWGRHYSFPWVAPNDSWSEPYNAEC